MILLSKFNNKMICQKIIYVNSLATNFKFKLYVMILSSNFSNFTISIQVL